MEHPELEYYVVLIEKQAWRDAHEIYVEKNNFKKKKFQSNCKLHSHFNPYSGNMCLYTYGHEWDIERYKVHIGYFKEGKEAGGHYEHLWIVSPSPLTITFFFN